jgi:hypothetical protein
MLGRSDGVLYVTNSWAPSILEFSLRRRRLFSSILQGIALIANSFLPFSRPRNPGGVRFGSAEIYDVLDTCFSGPPATSKHHNAQRIADSLVVGQMTEDRQDERVVLFVKLDQGEKLTQETVQAIKQEIRVRRSARHVPCCVSHLSVFRCPTPPYHGPRNRIRASRAPFRRLYAAVSAAPRHGIRLVPRRRG